MAPEVSAQPDTPDEVTLGHGHNLIVIPNLIVVDNLWMDSLSSCLNDIILVIIISLLTLKPIMTSACCGGCRTER